MRSATTVRLAVVAVVLAAGFSGGALAGRVAGPLDVPGRPQPHGEAAAVTAPQPQHATPPRAGHHSLEMSPGGLLVSQQGYTLAAPTTVLGGAPDELFRFQILGPGGAVVGLFEEHHQRYLHLVVVSRDLGAYYHLHPWIEPDGTWMVNMPALAPGAYHAFASFVVVDGPALTLSVGLLVPGETFFAPLPETGAVVAVDGYSVALAGTPAVGAATGLTVTVSRDGQPVVDIEPYLGALGHLVAIRSGDLAYSHVHPVSPGAGPGGPDVPFMLEMPSSGDYRLFFDFSQGGAVHTAAFTVHVPAGPGSGEGEATA